MWNLHGANERNLNVHYQKLAQRLHGEKGNDMTRKAMVHSAQEVQDVEIIQYKSANDITVRTKSGTVCHAIDNPFTGLIYADDLYAIIEGGSTK